MRGIGVGSGVGAGRLFSVMGRRKSYDATCVGVNTSSAFTACVPFSRIEYVLLPGSNPSDASSTNI